jgi:hypothetical protein
VFVYNSSHPNVLHQHKTADRQDRALMAFDSPISCKSDISEAARTAWFINAGPIN